MAAEMRINMTKKGILAVSFGTTYRETREKNIEKLVSQIRDTCPEYFVYQAYSSPTVRKVLKERDGLFIPDVKEALCHMKHEGIREVTVFPTHLINGIEVSEIRQVVEACRDSFDKITMADALLTTDADYEKTAKALWHALSDVVGEDILILMGHGSAHEADKSYPVLEEKFRKYADSRVYIATVEGTVTIDDIIERLAFAGRKGGRVWLVPFMLVAGDHAHHDMAGEEDSFAAKLKTAGFEPHCLIQGIGEYEEIREIYLEHLKCVLGG